jgi:hypothetical protein
MAAMICFSLVKVPNYTVLLFFRYFILIADPVQLHERYLQLIFRIKEKDHSTHI